MEELKLVLEAVSGMGDEAKGAFFTWLAYRTFGHILTIGTILLICYWLMKLVSNIAATCTLSGEVATAMGIGLHKRSAYYETYDGIRTAELLKDLDEVLSKAKQ